MIVAVVGGKGGVGKTTVAYDLAAAADAVAVDADLGMADLPGGRGPDLHDVLAGRATAVEAVRESGPVEVLPCGRTLAGARASDLTRLVDALEAVERAYGRVVVDCPAGLGSDVGVGLCAAKACVLVTRPERAAVADAIRARALARELDTGLARVVLNRAGDDAPADALARELDAPVTTIPESTAVARARSAGRPVTETAPESAAAERLERLAAAVYDSRSA